MKKIGGFFPLQPDQPLCHGSVWANWHEGHVQAVHLFNARSVLLVLARAFRPATIWLPAYICTDVPRALEKEFSLRYYGVDALLRKDVSVLEADLEAGDMVLGVDYFGHTPGPDFQDLVKARRDVVWVEDRALAPSPASTWGDWLVYSGRKLFGVTDGGIGICVSDQRVIDAPALTPNLDCRFMLPAITRYEDTSETHNAHWYKLYQEAEAAHGGAQHSMSRLSQHILQTYDAEAVFETRRANAAVLYQQLADTTVFGNLEETSVPGGVPIRVANKAGIAKDMAAKGFYLATHWPSLPSPETEFPDAHALSVEILTVPCDQRYDTSDMIRLANALKETIAAHDR